MKEEAQIADDDDQVVVIHDELAEWEADDPTFGGMREGARLDEAYKQLIARFRELYADRFRHHPPEDEKDLCKELFEEIDLPREQELARIVAIVAGKEKHSPEEEDALVEAAEEFLKY